MFEFPIILMVAKSGRKPKPAKEAIIKMKQAGKSTSEIIAALGVRDQGGKDYVYHVISEARSDGKIRHATEIGGGGLPALPAPRESASSGLVIEEAEVADEASEVSGMYSDRENGELPKQHLPIFSQSPSATGNAPQIPATGSEPDYLGTLPQDEGTEIDLSDITELPIEIEDRMFKRRGLDALTEREKEHIRNHGNVMIQKRIKLKHPLGDVINYAKAVVKPVLTRVLGRKFTKDVEEKEAEETDAMKEYNRMAKEKAEGK